MWLVLLACTGGGVESGDDDDDTGTGSGTDDTGVTDYLDQIDPADLPAGDNPCRSAELVYVDYVVDGDTAWVDSSQGEELVRFIGLDTPEVGWDGDDSECYGDEAQAFTREHLEDARAWLTFDSNCYDYYDRTLAYVHNGTGDQGFFNRVLIRSGYAQTLPYDETDTFEDLFDEDEDWARSNGMGGWSSCGW